MTELQSLLRTLGITANLRGFRYLKRATELAIEDPDCLLNIGKLIYNTVAQEFETTPKCVERNIRTRYKIHVGSMATVSYFVKLPAMNYKKNRQIPNLSTSFQLILLAFSRRPSDQTKPIIIS